MVVMIGKRGKKGNPLSSNFALTIVGWGNQARAWAANLRDSGRVLHIYLRPQSNSITAAGGAGTVVHAADQIPTGGLALLIPDHEIAGVVAQLAPALPAGQIFFYAHGYALEDAQLAQKFPQHHHVLLAPKAIATEVRATYLEKRPLGGVYSVEKVQASEREAVEQLTLAVCRDLGITMGPYPCKVREEMVADLFSEQAVLCSVIPEACKIAFEMLRARGIPAELAYFELWHEVGLIVRTMVDRGPEAFFNLISPNALIGAEKGRELLCGEEFHAKMGKLLREIENGTFQKEVSKSDPQKLRHQTVERWKDSEFNSTITRMQS